MTGIFARDHFDQRDQMRRIEGVTDKSPLSLVIFSEKIVAVMLEEEEKQQGLRFYPFVEFGIEVLFERDAFRTILLDIIGIF